MLRVLIIVVFATAGYYTASIDSNFRPHIEYAIKNYDDLSNVKEPRLEEEGRRFARNIPQENGDPREFKVEFKNLEDLKQFLAKFQCLLRIWFRHVSITESGVLLAAVIDARHAESVALYLDTESLNYRSTEYIENDNGSYDIVFNVKAQFPNVVELATFFENLKSWKGIRICKIDIGDNIGAFVYFDDRSIDLMENYMHCHRFKHTIGLRPRNYASQDVKNCTM